MATKTLDWEKIVDPETAKATRKIVYEYLDLLLARHFDILLIPEKNGKGDKILESYLKGNKDHLGLRYYAINGSTNIYGFLKGKDVVLFDDGVKTGSTINTIMVDLSKSNAKSVTLGTLNVMKSGVKYLRTKCKFTLQEPLNSIETEEEYADWYANNMASFFYHCIPNHSEDWDFIKYVLGEKKLSESTLSLLENMLHKRLDSEGHVKTEKAVGMIGGTELPRFETYFTSVSKEREFAQKIDACKCVPPNERMDLHILWACQKELTNHVLTIRPVNIDVIDLNKCPCPEDDKCVIKDSERRSKKYEDFNCYLCVCRHNHIHYSHAVSKIFDEMLMVNGITIDHKEYLELPPEVYTEESNERIENKLKRGT